MGGYCFATFLLSHCRNLLLYYIFRLLIGWIASCRWRGVSWHAETLPDPLGRRLRRGVLSLGFLVLELLQGDAGDFGSILLVVEDSGLDDFKPLVLEADEQIGEILAFDLDDQVAETAGEVLAGGIEFDALAVVVGQGELAAV